MSENEMSQLIEMGNSIYKNQYTGGLYLFHNGQMIPMINPLDGSNLKMGENGFFDSITSKMKFRLLGDGSFQPVQEPYTGAELTPLENGLYYSEYLKGNFMYDQKRQNYIPLFILDLTQEKAHMDGDFLVGDESGRRFPILPSGRVLSLTELKPKKLKTKEDIEAEKKRLFNMSQSEINENLNTYYFNYKNEKLETATKELEEERRKLIERGEAELKAEREKVEARIQQREREIQNNLEQRQRKLDDLNNIVDKIYKQIDVSVDERIRLYRYAKEGLIDEQEFNSVIEFYKTGKSSSISI